MDLSERKILDFRPALNSFIPCVQASPIISDLPAVLSVERGADAGVLCHTGMPMKSLNFFALAYLSDWWQYDGPFVSGLSPCSDRSVRLRWLREAATYYQVSRNFPKERDGAERLGKALDLIDAALNEVGNTITLENVDLTVGKLAKEFQSTYGNEALSAASKFPWIRHRSPVAIYDSRAFTCLNGSADIKLPESDYGRYRKEWQKQFDSREEHIRLACAELVHVRDFSPDEETDENLRFTIASRWFHERVFDKFLWWNGRKSAA